LIVTGLEKIRIGLISLFTGFAEKKKVAFLKQASFLG